MSDPAVPARERRIHKRRPLVASVWLMRGATKTPVNVANVSIGGAAVYTTATASIGEMVTLEVAPAARPAFALAAKVVRAELGILAIRFLALGQRALEALLETSGVSADGATEDPSGVHHLGSDETPG
jgi:hypothetical protein